MTSHKVGKCWMVVYLHISTISMEHANVILQQLFRSTEEQVRIACIVPSL